MGVERELKEGKNKSWKQKE